VIHASIFRFEGQITVFPPPARLATAACTAAAARRGRAVVRRGRRARRVARIMGVLQATEAIKLVLGLGESLAGRLVVYDAIKTRFRELRLAAIRRARPAATASIAARSR